MTKPKTADAPTWQRPPFAPDNTVALTHGAYSPKVIDPLAAQIIADYLAKPSCPAHIKNDPERWQDALEAWAHAKAVVTALRGHRPGQDVEDALTETSEAEETTEHRKSSSVTRTSGKRRTAPLDALHKWMRLEANLRNDLLESPRAAAAARAELAPKFDLALEIAQLDEAGTDGR